MFLGGNDMNSAFQPLSEEIPSFRYTFVLESKFNFCRLMLADEIFLFALFYSLYNDSRTAVNKAVNFTKSFIFVLKIPLTGLSEVISFFRDSFHGCLNVTRFQYRSTKNKKK